MGMHLFKMLIKLTMLGVVFAETTTPPLAKPDCQTRCGNISVPYPFGIGDGCAIDTNFLVTCDTNFNPAKLFLTPDNHIRNSTLNSVERIEVHQIYLQGHQLKISNPVAYDCYNNSTRNSLSLAYTLPKFFISNTKNKFTAVGCDTHAFIGSSHGLHSAMGCLSLCDSMTDVINGSCSGIGCCQTMIPTGVSGFDVNVSSYKNNTSVRGFNPCSFAFPVEDGAFNFSSSDLKDLRNITEVPLILDWAVGSQTCNESINNTYTYACKNNSNCTDSNNGPGYRCTCLDGFHGNPYLTNGCLDIDECLNQSTNNCPPSKCKNTNGSYFCYELEPYSSPSTKGEMITIGICAGVVGLSFQYVAAEKLYEVTLKIKANKREKKYTKKNSGLYDKIKKFNLKEIEKATDKFNVERRQGNQGTVYKGMLTDGRIVAVKKSKVVGEGKLDHDQFIKEVVNLSQINHMNVVKILGCCLETKFPLLVYEFIPNRTLFQYLHDGNCPLTWDIRLRIARDVAGALSNLHDSAIYHRNIKSTNILLYDKYRVKVADFGILKSVSIDQTHVTTQPQGSCGYMDPEFYQSNQFTKKSDVYSFGVVLVELLTGKKPIFSTTSTEEPINLAEHFRSKDENHLFEILDAQVNKGDRNEVLVVAKLAKGCLNLNGKQRPPMNEGKRKLDQLGIQKSQKDFNDSQNYEDDECIRTEMDDYSVNASTSTGSCHWWHSCISN